MNAHCPQSVEAATELREIAAVPLQIVSPRDSAPIVSVVQDTLVGANRFTRPDVLFTRREAMNLLVHAKRWDGTLPEPAVTDPVPKWSGQQLLSALLPPISLQMPNSSYSEDDKKNPASQNLVKIVNGKIIQGILDSSVFSKQLIHVMYNDYGPELTVDFLDSLQAMIANFLMDSGFSVGISDLIADEGTNTEINEALKKITSSIEEQILQLHTGLFENSSGRTNQEEFEGKLMGALNKATSEAGKIGLKSLSSINRMTNMVKAGSKGSDTNVSQMIAALGQQAIEGKRVPNGFQHRTLPHYKRFDDSAKARGFITSSFIKGLNPDEFFFHAMSGREGLIDTAVKTADTGYMQRQIRVALEDLISQHDGSVRDVTGNILQMRYGEDGINATKLENQMLPLAEMSDADIRDTYAAEGDAREEAYIAAAMADRKMLVEGVFGSKMNKGVKYPVHLDRILRFGGIASSFHLADRTDASPPIVTPAEALDAQDRILSRTHKDNRLWAALVRYYLSPRNLQKLNYTKAALDAVVEEVIVKHMKSWVEPGQPVGVIAAQSIGEPATQMTLNSVDWDERIVIAKNGNIMTPKIGEFIDTYYESCDKTTIQYMPNNQVYIPLSDGHSWKALSCDESGKMMWTTLEAITRHPVVNADGTNTILEVTLDSGRKVKATKAKSFLTLVDGKLVPTNGSDLKIGDTLPLSQGLALHDLEIIKTISTRDALPKSEWIYSSEVQKALQVLNACDVSGDRHWFKQNNGKIFDVPYARSDAFRDAFVNGKNTHTLQDNCVYPKHMCMNMAHIPADIPLDANFGFFVGAYLAEGMSNSTQVNITNNDTTYLEKASEIAKRWNIGTHQVSEARHCSKTGIRGHTSSLILHSVVLARLMGSLFGKTSYEKTLPDWVFQAPDEFVKALVDGYMSGDGSVSKKHYINATSVSERLITRLSLLLSRYGIHTTIQTRTPEKKQFDAVHMYYTMYIPVSYSKVFANTFHLSIAAKQERLDTIRTLETRLYEKDVFGQTILDKIVDIREVLPMKEWVYDVTVEKTRNFLLENTITQRDTFHLAGVAAKSNVTRGVPRLKELLKATRNPKAIELTVPLRRDLRNKKEDARRVAQELEFTLLQDLVTTARIYYDPRDDATLVAEDADWLAFMAAYEKAAQPAPAVQQPDPLTETEYEVPEAPKKSPWILRFELDRERMFAKSITMDDIAYVLKSKFGADLSTIYTDYNSQNLVFRMRLAADQKNPVDDLNTLKTLQNKVLTGTAIRGIPGLRSVNYQKVSDVVELHDGKYAPVDQYILTTDGSNFLDVLCHPDVDPTRVISSNVHDMFENLGIEATRAILYKEMSTLFEESGTNVNYRHVGLLVDKMCTKGRLMSVDRYGINKNDIGPLAKMSFEQTEDIALRAAQFGERDPVLGVSANVMLGAPIRAGTAFTEILLDEAAAIELANTTPEQTFAIRPTAGPQAFTTNDIDNALYMDDSMDCAPARIKLDVALPPVMETIPEDIPDIEIAVLEA
jgi:DNA-directed RNA polymerase beta' subunit